MPRTLAESSISARPGGRSSAAWSWLAGGRIIFTTDGSVPCVPLGYTTSFTRPSVALSQAAPMSSRAACHGELAGENVESLMVIGRPGQQPRRRR